MAKEILFDEEARRALSRGVDALALLKLHSVQKVAMSFLKKNSAHRLSQMTA